MSDTEKQELLEYSITMKRNPSSEVLWSDWHARNRSRRCFWAYRGWQAYWEYPGFVRIVRDRWRLAGSPENAHLVVHATPTDRGVEFQVDPDGEWSDAHAYDCVEPCPEDFRTGVRVAWEDEPARHLQPQYRAVVKPLLDDLEEMLRDDNRND